jgi:hypothetical protein
MARQATNAATYIEIANNESDALDEMNLRREGCIYNRLKGYLPGIGEWKGVAFALFQLKVLRPFLIRESATHI